MSGNRIALSLCTCMHHHIFAVVGTFCPPRLYFLPLRSGRTTHNSAFGKMKPEVNLQRGVKVGRPVT